MSRAWFLVVALVLLLGVARAEEGLVQIPGAFAEIGWNGRFSSGGWVEFRLVATSGGAFSAKLETSEGKVLEGLTPVSAWLELPEGAGVRETRLLIPIVSTRLVRLTLSSTTGTVTKRFEPSAGWLELDSTRLPKDPSLYLAGHTIFGQLEPSVALAAVAGGANLRRTPIGLPRGNLGLGSTDSDVRPMKLLEILKEFAPTVAAPERRHTVLGLWSVGVFIVLLGLYNLKRTEPRYTIGMAVCSAFLAGLGWWASLPKAPFLEAQRQVLIGAKGWGTRWTIHARYALRPDWRLPTGALPLERLERLHRQTETVFIAKGWQQIRYLTPPTAVRVPIRLENGKLINQSKSTLEKIFIRGIGRQEPLASGATRTITNQIYQTLPWDEYTEAMQLLPENTVMAQQPDGTLLIALTDKP